MIETWQVLFVTLVWILIVRCIQSYRIGLDPYRRGAYLNDDNRYLIEWATDEASSRITFNLTVETKGWVLFGLANNASEATGRDVVIGGVGNGGPYFWDGHSKQKNQRVERDPSQDYRLEGYRETGTHTFLSFSRQLDTCDEYDYAITENKATIIWGFGVTDKEENTWKSYSESSILHGTYEIYLLDPEFAPRITRPKLYSSSPQIYGKDSSSVKVWSVTETTYLPSNHTVQLCTIHKAPRLGIKHHVIGFDVRFANDISRIHTHHLLIFKCRAPHGTSERNLFEKYAQSREQEICHNTFRPVVGRDMPHYFCTQIYYIWAVGGRAYFNPDNVGFPFGESQDEYYLFQYHYNNPNMTSDLTISLKTDIFYTRNLRQHDGGLMAVGQDITSLPTTLLIPPKSSYARVFGHCSPECTRRLLPEDGITVVAGWLHSHFSGRQFRIRHFRGNRELPWLLYDDNYNHQFQQFRNLPHGPNQVLPGDQLTIDCIYDNTWTNGTIAGGYIPFNQEMCFTMLIYYNLIPDYSFCRSEMTVPEARRHFLGVRNVTWMEPHLDWVAISPSPTHLVGLNVTEIADNFVRWDKDKRQDLQRFLEVHPQTGRCTRDINARDPNVAQQMIEDMLSLQRASGVNYLLIPDNEPTIADTDDDYMGPVEYPSLAVPYNLPESRCTHKPSLLGWPMDDALHYGR